MTIPTPPSPPTPQGEPGQTSSWATGPVSWTDAEALLGRHAALVRFLVERLRDTPGVAAVALGGSYASGTARPDSDLDLGLYYRQAAPFDIAAIRQVADEVNDTPAPTVTDFGGWGRWVNGGAWLTIQGQRVDFLYRNLDQIARVITACREGEWEQDYLQQFTHGFYSYIYLGEVSICRPLCDPEAVLDDLKAQVTLYPPLLRQEIVREWLRGQMWWPVFHKFAARGDVYNVAGSINRIAAGMTQVLFALNETYFVTDKGALERIESLALKPRHYGGRMRAILGHPGTMPDELADTVRRLEELSVEVATLCMDQLPSVDRPGTAPSADDVGAGGGRRVLPPKSR